MDLNDDLAPEILLHLPAQSLLRFRSVCKAWCSIIDSSMFRESHRQNLSKNNQGDNLFLRYTSYCLWELSILKADKGQSHKGFPAFQKFSEDSKGFGSDELCIVGPVNGLICMYNRDSCVGYSDNRKSFPIAIYNPCLDKIKILPPSLNPSSIGHALQNGTYYIGAREIGFGYNNVSKEYKVLQLTCFRDGPSCVEVYSGTTNTWTKLNTDGTLDGELFLHTLLAINSSVYTKSRSMSHWQAERRVGHTKYVILSFDMEIEVFETISYPNFDDSKVDVTSSEVFAKDDDSFALFVYSRNGCILEVWEVERRDKERGWTHVTDIVIDVPLMPRLSPWPIALWKRDGVVLMEYGSNQHTMVYYDYLTGKVIKCCGVPITDADILEYKGSLVSP